MGQVVKPASPRAHTAAVFAPGSMKLTLVNLPVHRRGVAAAILFLLHGQGLYEIGLKRAENPKTGYNTE
ncbi:MAG: hypothetical protein N2646_09190 [Bellilinea sp.]|nr:hypothetical protein [Bellilinea sp.]